MRRTARHSLLLAGRILRYIPRAPEQLADVTVMPVVMIVLFGFIFGSAIHLPGTVNYRDYLIPGMFTGAMLGTLSGLMVAVAGDARSPYADRLRSLPIRPVAILLGRLIAELATSILGLAVLVIAGYVAGWRPHATGAGFAAAMGLLIVWSFASSWLGCLLGLLVRDAESAGAIGSVVIFPLMLLSGNFVPAGSMPLPLRLIASWNPMTATSTAVRDLLHNPAPGVPHLWMLAHPVPATLLFSAALVAICAPLALRRFAALTS
jgi:ABC-2 type transport system permease protein